MPWMKPCPKCSEPVQVDFVPRKRAANQGQIYCRNCQILFTAKRKSADWFMRDATYVPDEADEGESTGSLGPLQEPPGDGDAQGELFPQAKEAAGA